MHAAEAVGILIGGFVVFMFMGMPVAYCVLFSSIITTAFIGIPLVIVIQSLAQGINVYPLMAIPFFILMGEIMSQGGIADRLVTLSKALVGWIRGSLGMVNVLASVFFGTIQGSASASTAAIGGIMVPMMEKEGYDVEFSISVTMSSAMEGVLIPPSPNLVLFALAAGNASVGRLFLAGILPGLLLAALLMGYCYYASVKRKYPKGDKFRIIPALVAFRNAAPALAAVLIVVVGVIGGIFTATEAAAIAVVYSLFISLFIYRGLKFRDLYGVFANSLKIIAIILILVGTSACFTWLLSYLQVPTMAAAYILSISTNPIVVMMMVNVFLLIAGLAMEMAPLILMTTPILLPIVTQVGVDPVQFGIIMILNLGIGLITPPSGGVLFIGCAISKLNMVQITKAMGPFFLVLLLTLIIVTYVPAFSMVLPNIFLPPM